MRTYIIFLLVPFLGLCQTDKSPLDVPKQMEQMSFLIGKWEFHWKNMMPDRSIQDGGVSQSYVYPILNESILCDDFLQVNPQGKVISGVTLRSYDPAEGKWKMKWIQSGSMEGQDFVGEMKDDIFIFLQTDDQEDEHGSYKVKVTFFDIKADTYSWRADRLYKNGYVLENVSSYVAHRKD